MPVNISQPVRPKPFLKWAGGKTQLLPEIQDILERKFSNDSAWTYIEPFVGGGAVLFHVLDRFPGIERAVINDINPELVAAYRAMKDNIVATTASLMSLEKAYNDCPTKEEKKSFYCNQRKEFNRLKLSPDSLVSSPHFSQVALFIFLNKTCFNGLYRVNRKGEFNVPFGDRKSLKICDRENLLRGSECLQKVTIELGDFEEMLKYAGKDVLYYIDPPYKPLNATSSFTAYTQEDFSDRDQFRVKAFCDRIHESGGYFILSNSDVVETDKHPSFFDELYASYTIKRVRAKRQINCKAEGRGSISELLITNIG
ncbi:DNA adenine methylase [Oscillatoria sp. FACHB-1406]|uniref:DNA adenine methylase n=1 Tax=Oscillatoria sp. FACHB-1406 TaxID=2692846 RepID=UPI001683A268|nr:DNA adenine methylase [Oscillatoria sp. FACHB-1406]MBD2578296.1 DNA adenine methylase [Oscillatoria sp. FACHB-1406]